MCGDSKLSTIIFIKCLKKQKHPWLTPRVRTPMCHLRTTPRLPDCCHVTGCLFFPYCTTPALHSSIQICNHHFLTALLPHSTALSKPATTTFTTLSPTCGIEPGPPAWESSTLPSEPQDVRKHRVIFSTYILNIRVRCVLHFHLFSFIIKI